MVNLSKPHCPGKTGSKRPGGSMDLKIKPNVSEFLRLPIGGSAAQYRYELALVITWRQMKRAFYLNLFFKCVSDSQQA
jgi:hypothetical protein